MILKHIKLRNREDLLCFITSDDGKGFITVDHPIAVEVTPEEGVFAKNWMMFTEGQSVKIPINTIMYVGDANQKAVEYYEDFYERLSKRHDEDVDEYEELFEAVLESKTVTKH